MGDVLKVSISLPWEELKSLTKTSILKDEALFEEKEEEEEEEEDVRVLFGLLDMELIYECNPSRNGEPQII